MMKKDKSQMMSNQNTKKSDMNWSMKKMQNMRLYLSMIMLKHLNGRKRKYDPEEEEVTVKPWI